MDSSFAPKWPCTLRLKRANLSGEEKRQSATLPCQAADRSRKGGREYNPKLRRLNYSENIPSNWKAAWLVRLAFGSAETEKQAGESPLWVKDWLQKSRQGRLEKMGTCQMERLAVEILEQAAKDTEINGKSHLMNCLMVTFCEVLATCFSEATVYSGKVSSIAVVSQ